MDGVEAVCHAAAVYSYFDPDREQEIIDASVNGVEAALRAAAHAKVRKVVPTSSAVTVPLTAPGAPPSTERDWTGDLRVPYIRAKTEAERLAWKLAYEGWQPRIPQEQSLRETMAEIRKNREKRVRRPEQLRPASSPSATGLQYRARARSRVGKTRCVAAH
jgi:nucleoside-diphosphate-sugar epimerase